MKRALGTAYKVLKQAYGVMIGPPRYYVGPPSANVLGLQLARLGLSRLGYNLRPRVEHPDVAEMVATIERDGVVVIPNFFPPDVFARIETAFDRLRSSDEVKTEENWKGDTGIRCHMGMLSGATDDSRFIMDTVGQNETIRKVVGAVMRREPAPHERPVVHYQHLELPRGGEDQGDAGQKLHADRFFPTIKVVLFVNDNTEEAGATIFCRGTHRMSIPRVAHEYVHSIADARMRKGYGLDLLDWLTGHGWVVHDHDGPAPVSNGSRRSLGIEEQAVSGRKNTLVIADHVGFHRRGVMQPGTERKHIRLIFHNLERSWYADALMRARRGAPRSLPGIERVLPARGS